MDSLWDLLVQWVRLWRPVKKCASSLGLFTRISSPENTSMSAQFVRFLVCQFCHGSRVDKSELVRFLRNQLGDFFEGLL